MIVYITRHAQPAFPPPEVEEDPEFPSSDRPISELGREQARLLGLRMEAIGFGGGIRASPYRRTCQTANIICEALGSQFRPAAPFREIVQREETILAFSGLTLAELQDEFAHLTPGSALAYPWWTTELEDSDVVRARVAPFVDHLVATGSDDVLLVGHGASTGAATRYLLTHCEDVPDDIPLTWNCALTAFRCSAGANGEIASCEMIMLQDTTHMDEDQVTSNAKFRYSLEDS